MLTKKVTKIIVWHLRRAGVVESLPLCAGVTGLLLSVPVYACFCSIIVFGLCSIVPLFTTTDDLYISVNIKSKYSMVRSWACPVELDAQHNTVYYIHIKCILSNKDNNWNFLLCPTTSTVVSSSQSSKTYSVWQWHHIQMSWVKQ